MSINSKMTAIADAIRDKTGKTDSLTLDQMATEIAGIETGGGNSGMELLYETTFTLEESQVGVSKTDIVTIETGIKQGHQRNLYLVVIECINDTDSDDSYNHFKARTQTFCLDGGVYFQNQANSGINITAKYGMYGAIFGLYVNSGTQANKGNGVALTLRHSAHATWGTAPSGDYSVRVFELTPEFFGIEGVA